MYKEDKCCFKISVEWYTINNDGNDEREKYIEISGNGFDTKTAIEYIANNLNLTSGSHVVEVDLKDGRRMEYASPLLSIRYESFSKKEMTLSIDKLRCNSHSDWNQTCKEKKVENENLNIIKCLDVIKNEEFYRWSINKEQINESEYLKNLPHFNSENLNKWVVHYLDFYPDKYNIIIKPNVDLSDKESFILFMIDFIDLLREYNNNYNSWLHLDIESMISEITLADKKIKFKKRAKKIIDNYTNIIFETIRFSTIHIYPFGNNIINIYLESFPRIQRQYSEHVILKEFKMDSQEKIKEFMSFIFNIGICKSDNIKQINTLILTYHTILNDYIFEEDIEKRKKIINSYYPVFNEEEKFLLCNGFLSDEFIKLSNDLIQEHDVNLADFNSTNTYSGSTIYKGEYLLMKHQQEEQNIPIPDITNTYELYDFQYKYLLAQKGIRLSKFMLRDMIHNICLKHNLDRLCFFKEYQAILKIRRDTKVHKELFESFCVKNAPYDYRYSDNEPNNPFDSYEVEDRDWIRQSYNEYYGQSGEGWADTSEW